MRKEKLSILHNRNSEYSGGTRGGLEGATAPIGSTYSPVGRNFGFLSAEIWPNDVRKLHF